MSEEVRGKPSRGSAETGNTSKNEDDEELRSELLQDVPEWLQDFKKSWWIRMFNHINTLPALLMNYQRSREQKWYRARASTVSVLTFRRTQIAISAWRQKLTRASCRRRAGTVVPRAENVCDLTTADQKLLSEGCQSQNNHRYAVVVQDLATQWLQSYPWKTKPSQETEKSLQKFLKSTRNPKNIYIDNSLEFGKACEDLHWNHSTSTPHRSETNGSVERAVRRVKEGTSAVLLQSGLNENWWADSMECYCYLRNIQDLLSDGKRPIHHVKGITLFLWNTCRDCISSAQKSCQVYSLDMRCTRG